MSFCTYCGGELTEYLGFNKKPGEGDLFCVRCEESDGIPVEVDPSTDLTPIRWVLPTEYNLFGDDFGIDDDDDYD